VDQGNSFSGTDSTVYQQNLTAAIRIFPADAGESMAQIAAIQESIRHRAEDRPPKAVFLKIGIKLIVSPRR